MAASGKFAAKFFQKLFTADTGGGIIKKAVNTADPKRKETAWQTAVVVRT
jgi:hypothetical protein